MNLIDGIDQLTEIHQSNNSLVFSGIDRKTGKKVAIKILNEEYPSPQLVARFNEEAEISQRFQIAGLRKIIEKRKINNRHALIMEYIEGVSFQELIREQKSISLEFFLNLAIRACGIIAEIHKNGIIHKDINPKNLLLQDEEDVFLIDLGIATLSQKEHQKLQAPDKLEGTLAYISPEQTGRMNHAVDARSDLYALGITFYEILTGVLPFQSTDSMELVHSHIAKIPEAPQTYNPTIPFILSKIILKLMEKNSYKRYQTALGLRLDLEYCLETWTQKGEKAFQELDFELASQDYNSNFQIPEKLYGREKERTILLDSFAKIEQGGLGFVLCSGYSGVGKTALIRELYKPVTQKRSYFFAGKFEQFQRDIPYSAFINAINAFIQQILGESPKRLAHWKAEFLEALGNNAGVLSEVIPSIELIIGKQESPIALPPVENQNRFNSVLQKFFRDLSNPKHAFVVFIDDWQWADLPSLNLLKLLTTDTENGHLLFIAAYSDNEVDESHPFMMSLNEIQKTIPHIQELQLKDLQLDDISQLIADTLNESDENVMDLAKLIQYKTQGNPFFVSQFLQNLYSGGHILYNYTQRIWEWDSQKIAGLPISNNVVDLMQARIAALDTNKQGLLQLAACIGNNFPVKLLSQLAQKPQVEVRKDLVEILEQGLILPYIGDHYSIEDESDQNVHFRFLHDRVEQAANQLLSREVFEEKQWEIGELMLQKGEKYRQEHLFDLVNYLNNGRKYAQSEGQQALLAELNYEAGKKAKRSTAYSAAEKFLGISQDYFGESIWQSDYKKAFDLYKEQGENYFLLGNFSESEKILAACMRKAQSDLDKSEIYKIQIAQLSGQGKYGEAVQMAIEAVKIFGVELPNLSQEAQIQEVASAEIGAYLAFVGEKGIEALGELPECEKQDIKAAMEILAMALDCATVGVPAALGLLAMKMNNLSIKFGLSNHSITAYVFTAIIYGAGFKDFKSAYHIADLARNLAKERKGTEITLPKVYHIFAYFAPIIHKTDYAGNFNQKAYEKGVELGDFVYASYGIGALPRFYFPMSIEIGIEKTKQALLFLQKNNNLPMVMNMYLGFTNLIKNWDAVSEPSFDCEGFHEQNFLDTFNNAAPLLVAIYKRYKLQSSYILNIYPIAYQLVKERNTWIAILGGIDIVWRSEYYLYSALTVSVLYDKANDEQKSNYAIIINECLDELKILLDCSDNFAPHYYLVKAEKARIEGDRLTVMDNYDNAIEVAEKMEIPQYTALASERAALFFLSKNKNDIAKVYLQRALAAYQTWGAEAKVKQLKENYPQFLAFNKSNLHTAYTMHTSSFGSLLTTNYGQNSLDLLSVMKASQAISEEIKLDLLLRKMIVVLMENAGAERALLIQDRQSELMLAAEASIHSPNIEIMRTVPLNNEDRNSLALNIIRHVYRTQEIVVADDAKKDSRYAMDLYVQKGSAKSILCMPITHQGKVRLVIYMEHSQIAGAFTQERIEVLKMLSTQIAISIENSVLYDTLEQKVSERTADLEKANEQLKDKNLRITDSINYAQTMQQAILPSEAEIGQISDDNFVLYLPKDIVSGDFYWYGFVNHTHILAVIDCTGHGVPGAFMSMIANTLLNEIVNQKQITQTDQILEQLHKGVREALSQESSNNTDGMDMALCSFVKSENGIVLQFSGAKNVLYYIKDGTFGKLEANKRSIGGLLLGKRQLEPFTSKELVLSKGDVFYLTTDGFADQAGGESRKPFSKMRLMELFQQHWQLPMSEQKEIYLEALKMHQGNNAQRDDITLIGIRVE